MLAVFIAAGETEIVGLERLRVYGLSIKPIQYISRWAYNKTRKLVTRSLVMFKYLYNITDGVMVYLLT